MTDEYLDRFGVVAEPGGYCARCEARLPATGKCTNPACPFHPVLGQMHREQREGLGLEPTELDLLIEANDARSALADGAARWAATERLLDELVVWVAERWPSEACPAGWDLKVVRDARIAAIRRGLVPDREVA